MNTFTRNAARLLKGVAALSVTAFGLALAPVAQAQSGTVSLGNCSATNNAMTGFTWSGSVLTVTCPAGGGGGPTIDPLAGTFVLSSTNAAIVPLAAASIPAGGSFTAYVVRQAGWIGAYDVAWTASGNVTASPSSGVASFGDHDGFPRPITITAGNTGGTITLSLSTVTSKSDASLTTTASGTATITVIGPPPPVKDWATDPATPQVNCGTTASVVAPVFFTFNAQKQLFTLLPGQTAAIPFVLGAGASPFVQSTETVSTPSTAEHEVAISQCPGDFSPPLGVCRAYYSFNGGTVYMNTNGNNSTFACGLVPGNKYYVNVRQVFRNTTTSSCPSNAQGGTNGITPGCDVKLQIQGM
jgi:hypothetical protein